MKILKKSEKFKKSKWAARVVVGLLFSHLAFAQEPAAPPQSPAPQAEAKPADEDQRQGVKWGVAPIGNFSTDQGFTFGILGQRFDYGLEKRLPFENLLTMQLSYATQGRKALLLQHEITHLTEYDLRIQSELFIQNNPFQSFFGVGDDTRIDSTATSGFYQYNLTEVQVFETLRKKWRDQWEVYAGIVPTYYQLKTSSTPSTLFYQATGLEDQTQFNTKFTAGVILDRRNYEFITYDGMYFSGGVMLAPGFLGNTGSTWHRFSLDYRKYFNVIDDRWLWFAVQVRYVNSAVETPIPEKSVLGSQSTVRGFRGGRYLTNHVFTYRAEVRTLPIRWSIFKLPLKAGAGLFLDMGRVGDNFGRLFQTKNLTGWGVTVFGSYFTDDFLGHMDIGFSDDGTSVYVGLGHAI